MLHDVRIDCGNEAYHWEKNGEKTSLGRQEIDKKVDVVSGIAIVSKSIAGWKKWFLSRQKKSEKMSISKMYAWAGSLLG